MLAVTCSFSLKRRSMLKIVLIKMRFSDLSLNGHLDKYLANLLLTPHSKQSYHFIIFMHSNLSIMKRLFPLITHTPQKKAYVNTISILPFLFTLLLIRTQTSVLISPKVPQELSRQKPINKGLFYKTFSPRNKASQAVS